MKKHLKWSYDQYLPIFASPQEIYICRLVPHKTSFAFEVKARGEEEYSVYVSPRFKNEWTLVKKTKSTDITVSNLSQGQEYEFYVEAGERKSRTRLVRCGESFGSVINYLHPEDKYYVRGGQFFSSPSILKHPDGYLLAAMDLFGFGESMRAFVFRSDDNGKSWHHSCDLFPAYCAKLFLHKGEVYAIAKRHSYGDLLIGKSGDGGKTFDLPTTLMYGTGKVDGPTAGIHKQAQPIVVHNGRIWCAMEWGAWNMPYHLAAFVASAPVDCDLLDAANWSFSEPLKYDENWEGTAKRVNMLKDTYGTLENCLVSTKDQLLSIARYEIEHCEPCRGKAVVYSVNTKDPEAPMRFEKVIDHPGNHAKFVIKYDEKRKKYFSLVNPLYTPTNLDTRNLVTLISSIDCMHWTEERVVYDYTRESAKKVGIQYIDFEIDGDEIILLARVGMNGADSYHNSNYIIFDRIKIER